MKLALALALGLACLPLPALAANLPGYPATTCSLSDDKSSVLVTASNGSSTAYQCTVWCKTTTSGTHAFTPVACSFKLGAGAANKIECTQSAPGGATFTAMVSQKSTCVPR